jgi:hypothetical protein
MRWHKVRNKGYEKMKREELHKLLFETLCIIDDICKKENVRWFLDSGTELGSLREQDIIPRSNRVGAYLSILLAVVGPAEPIGRPCLAGDGPI